MFYAIFFINVNENTLLELYKKKLNTAKYVAKKVQDNYTKRLKCHIASELKSILVNQPSIQKTNFNKYFNCSLCVKSTIQIAKNSSFTCTKKCRCHTQ